MISEKNKGLWDNIHAKRNRIKRGSNERMRRAGEKGRPTASDFKASQMTSENIRLQTIKRVLNEAKYQGREVPLNKPMAGDVKKSKVFVRDPKTGNVKKVNFGDKTLSIKKHIPARKKSYCARSSGQGNLSKKTSANYWSRKAWNC
jgi:hypothetical protein